ncbi:Rhodanese-like protein [Microthyrium microscopicum]|uniref:M-phase inducer phosphatase n=1 Tax=Microthyrium microscopicum TaxID=703497 RepID=A0A6A6TZB0_9PEZI|nr:Rhodanese-like protein [Microthyrium microscopicum]
MAMLSSPLAAMQPPPCPSRRGWGCGDMGESLPRSNGAGSFGRSSKFNFAELAMSKDYFSQKLSVRGSSPSASLAADLSQNFCIDQSPQYPTPRRSLFTSGLFAGLNRQEGATTPPIRQPWESVTTPPVPSSSPGFGNDAMDMSPLPHKPAFSFASKLSIESPSRKSPSDDDMISPCDTTPVPSMDLKPSFAERRKSILNRPSLARSKCLSTSNIVPRVKDNQLPAFTFGAGSSTTTYTLSTSLDESFQESPVQERNMFTNNFPSNSRSRFQSHSNALTRGTGSPLHGLTKKAAPAAGRPRKLYRRTLSMFEHPADVMKNQKQETTLDVVMDVDEAYQLKLPNFIPEDKPDSLPRINQDTMISILNGQYNEHYGQVMVIDCRFEYEYDGGHINGATNFNDKEKLARHLFDSAITNNTLLVFHCEYSAHRAPLMAKYIRQQDRAINAVNYPNLTYPEVYILDGGYSSFFNNHRSRCFPQSYVEMDAKEHEQACERGLNKIRQQRNKLGRAATFAFGQCSQNQESPSRPSSAHRSNTDCDLFSSRIFPRRGVSYP